MRVALLGYGKMGKIIEDVLLARKHTVVLKINEGNLEERTLDNLKSCDLAIEFSNPTSALSNYRLCFEADRCRYQLSWFTDLSYKDR